MDTKHIRIEDYNYPLPDERIAKYPLPQRDQSKLLIYNKGSISEDVFHHLPNHLPSGSLMVFNNTKVIQARLHFRKPTGALIEVFLLEPAKPADYEQMFQTRGQCEWFCLIGNLKKWKDGALLLEMPASDGTTEAIRVRCERVNPPQSSLPLGGESGGSLNSQPSTLNSQLAIRFTWEPSYLSFAELIDIAGELPIPPYLNRSTEESDKTTYQTVYSKIKGSVAAPTAGLHFTDQVLENIRQKGIETEEVTLHVGAGTFKPVKSEEIAGHDMHTEYFSVSRQTIARLLAHEAQAIAVGTTSVRTLESLYYIGCHLEAPEHGSADFTHVDQWEPYESVNGPAVTPTKALQNIARYLDDNQLNRLNASTQIIIAPGYEYKIVRALVTNFHQPQSTLLLLVSALVKGNWRSIYDYALAHQFRFLSYGDSSLIIP